MNQQRYQEALMFISQLDKRYAMNRGVGWIYALRNREYKRPLLKIGMTRNPPHQRAEELGSATGVPGRFELIYFVHTFNCAMAEAHVHQDLDRYRTAGEFFEVPIYRAVDAMDEAASLYRINVDLARPKKRGGWGSDWLPQVFEHQVFQCTSCGRKNRILALAVPIRASCSACGTALDSIRDLGAE